MKSVYYIDYLKDGLRELLQSDLSVHLLGEDIAEPYGGAFKVTKGLSLEFPDRVIQTPMSEQGFTGMAVGMALAGMKPIVEIMFGDFSNSYC
jgi:pyruvate/2-oxoglutarate/acetoin dehydrogenase E1 component